MPEPLPAARSWHNVLIRSSCVHVVTSGTCDHPFVWFVPGSGRRFVSHVLRRCGPRVHMRDMRHHSRALGSPTKHGWLGHAYKEIKWLVRRGIADLGACCNECVVPS